VSSSLRPTPAATGLAGPARWPMVALRWMPTFLGFPAGGLAAKLLVGPVDSPTAAVLGGALTGAVLGAVQWLGLRRYGMTPWPWIVATAAGLAVGLGAGAAAVGYATDLGSLAIQGAFSGAAIGVAQAVVLRRHLGRIAWAWPPLLAALWALGWTITSSAGIDVEAQYTVFGSSGALVVTALTSVLAITLARDPRP
jgi:hypothetical protein